MLNFWVCQIHWNYAQIIFSASFCCLGCINKDHTVELDGATRPSLKYVFDEIENLTNPDPSLEITNHQSHNRYFVLFKYFHNLVNIKFETRHLLDIFLVTSRHHDTIVA